MGYKGRMTGHGFRGVASTILHEQGYAHHAIELQLAHQERNEVSAAYNHALYLKERGVMMCEWANHLDKLRRGWMDTAGATGGVTGFPPDQAGNIRLDRPSPARAWCFGNLWKYFHK